MADSGSDDDFSRSIPFGVQRGTGQDPADRAPKRGATTGIGDGGERVVHVPGEGGHEQAPAPPRAIPGGSPRYPDQKE